MATNPTLGQTKYYKTSGGSGNTAYTSLPYGGNVPYGYTPIEREEYISGLQSNIQRFPNETAQGNAFNTEFMRKQLAEAQAQTGSFAPGYTSPDFAGFQPNAPTPSEQYFTPEKFASLAPGEQRRLQQAFPGSYGNLQIGQVPAGMREVQIGNTFGLTSAPIINNIPATSGAGPTLPTPGAPVATNAYYAGLTGQVTNLQTQLDAMRQQQLDKIQADKDFAQKELDSIRSYQGEGIAEQGNIAVEQKQAKLDQLAKEQARFDENYDKVQGLAGQLTDLMTQGNALIAEQKGATGLAAIRNPRIAQTISDVTAATGVIQAAISVYNGQMNQAQSQLTTATNVITSAYADQMDYYKTLNNFYESQAGDEKTKLINLTKDERNFLDNQITSLENKIKTTEANSEKMNNLFLDPDTALKFAQAGITITTPQSEWGPKLQKQAYSEELATLSKEMANDGYTLLATGNPPAGATIVQRTDSNGVVRRYWKKADAPRVIGSAAAGYYQYNPKTGQYDIPATGSGSDNIPAYETFYKEFLTTEKGKELAKRYAGDNIGLAKELRGIYAAASSQLGAQPKSQQTLDYDNL